MSLVQFVRTVRRVNRDHVLIHSSTGAAYSKWAVMEGKFEKIKRLTFVHEIHMNKVSLADYENY